jgi:glutathione peroxidase
MSFYDFEIKEINGSSINFDQFKGKHVLIVNVASKCGYTPQYEDLQMLHEQFGDKIAVLGFPANDFGGQEPGTNDQIADFCQSNYGVSFQMFEKIAVTGSKRHPLYTWLDEQTGNQPTWNFCKYLVSPTGEVLGFFPSSINPLDESITSNLK